MDSTDLANRPLALLGGPKTVLRDEPDLFHWPIVGEEEEWAVVEVLRAGSMSGLDITRQFEAEYAEWQGVEFALAHCNGTAAIEAAFFGCGLGRGDEVICPSLTYWASAMPAFRLGASVVFADIDADTLCIDPNDIERRITDRTKAIMVVHYCGHPVDMDPILDIARRHGLKVVEDVSHAHGAMYKGRMVGALGDVSAMSLMSGKSLAVGEGGMLCSNDREIYERAIAYGHYQRHPGSLTLPDLQELGGIPLGGVKFRISQTASAMGRVQLRDYPGRMQEIQDATNRFWDLLEGTPGLRPHRPEAGSGPTMGGWYNPVGHYVAEELGGLPLDRFAEAVVAEGGRAGRGGNFPLHLHPVLNRADVYHDGAPTRIAFSEHDLRQPQGSLPVAEAAGARTIGIPSFKRDRPEAIARHAAAFRKVALHAADLLG